MSQCLTAARHRWLASPHRHAALPGLALLGGVLPLAWGGGLLGSAPVAALLPSLGALLLWWGVGRVEAARPPSA